MITYSFSLLGKREKQQDAHAVCRDVREKGDLLIVVCDGHMPGGELFSRFVVEQLPKSFANISKVSTQSVNRLFKRFDAKLKKTLASKTHYSGGCTCALAYLKSDFTLPKIG